MEVEIEKELAKDMPTKSQSAHWNSRLSFIFAASAAAIGLGNIWRFPYMVGANGGAIFVFIYLACVMILGVPLLIGEIALGKMAQKNPVTAFANLAEQSHRSVQWAWVGFLNIMASYFILIFYVVITGWVIEYMIRAASGTFTLISEANSIAAFNALKANSWQMFVTTTLVILATMGIIVLGIKRGLERAVLIMFPLLFVLLLLLLGYSATTGHFAQGVRFLFDPDWSEINSRTVLLALGQAFFSLNVAMGVTMMFSAYLPKNTPITSSAAAIAAADTLFALLAGLIIFPIVFAYGLTPSAGPSLIFETLPIAFGRIPYGQFVGALFFIMLFFAAFSSVIALIEPVVCWLEQTRNWTRGKSVLISCVILWLLSFLTIGSFSNPEHFTIFGHTWFDAIDFVTASIMLPLGGLLIAIFCGWRLRHAILKQKLQWKMRYWYFVWRWILRYFSPIAIIFIFLVSFKII